MPENDDIEDSVDQLIALVALFHQIVHGGNNATVTTEGGVVPTASKALKDMGDLILNNNSVTTAKIVDGAVTLLKTTLAGQGLVGRTSGAGAGTLLATLNDTLTALGVTGVNGQILKRVGGSWVAGYERVVQEWVQVTTTSVPSVTTITPLDNTPPLITEGNEVFSLSVSPSSTSNKLKLELTLAFNCSAAATVSLAVYVNSDTVYYAVPIATCAIGEFVNASLIVADIPIGVTGAQLVRVRIGPSAAATLYINKGVTGAALFGGDKITSSMVVREVAAL